MIDMSDPRKRLVVALGGNAIIAHVNRFADALDGKSGTRIVRK